MMLVIFGLIVAILVLSLKTGLILGSSWLRTGQIIVVSLIFAVSLFALVVFFAPYQSTLEKILDKYTFAGSLGLALFLLYLGISEEGVIPIDGDVKRSWLKSVPIFLPCPLCLVALALTVMVVAPKMQIKPGILGAGIAVVFAVLLAGIALFSRQVVKAFKVKPQSLLNSVLVFFGIITLSCGLFIPNLVKSMSMQFSPMILSTGCWLGTVFLGMLLVFSLGYLKFNFNLSKGEKTR